MASVQNLSPENKDIEVVKDNPAEIVSEFNVKSKLKPWHIFLIVGISALIILTIVMIILFSLMMNKVQILESVVTQIPLNNLNGLMNLNTFTLQDRATTNSDKAVKMAVETFSETNPGLQGRLLRRGRPRWRPTPAFYVWNPALNVNVRVRADGRVGVDFPVHKALEYVLTNQPQK